MLKENNEYIEVCTIDNSKITRTGEIVKRGTKLKEGSYVVGVNTWIVGPNRKILMQKRSKDKKNNPNKWSSTNGLREIGENSIDTCIRETNEELGISIPKENIKYFGNKIAGESLIVDIFVIKFDVDINNITIQEEEVAEIRWISIEDLETLDISTTCQYIKNSIDDILELSEMVIDKER